MMSAARQRIQLIIVSTLVLFSLLAFSGQRAYGDELLLSDAGYVHEEVPDAEEIANDTRPVKAKNPVNVFMNKVYAFASDVKSAARGTVASGINAENNLAFVLAALFFLMLMLRFRKRARKSRFS